MELDRELLQQAARQGLANVLRQMAAGADDELTMQVLRCYRRSLGDPNYDDGLDVATALDDQEAVALAQQLAGGLATLLGSEYTS